MLLIYYYILGMIISGFVIFTAWGKGLRDKLFLTLFYPIVFIPLFIIIIAVIITGLFKNISFDNSFNYFFNKIDGTLSGRILSKWAKLVFTDPNKN